MFNKSYFKGNMKLENYARELETEGHRLQYRKERYQFGAAMVFLKENFPEPAAMHLLPFADSHLQNEVIALCAHSLNYLVQTFGQIFLSRTTRPLRLFAHYDEMLNPLMYLETTAEAAQPLIDDAELRAAAQTIATNGNYTLSFRAEKERFYAIFTFKKYREGSFSMYEQPKVLEESLDAPAQEEGENA
ncbi:MAG: hypothetical protein J6R40_04930 [Clostridia bacterium]|nr:hypothetical protein [Clostridia bacterium]